MHTYFAPAERATSDQLQAARTDFFDDKLAAILLDAMPDLAAVLNPQRQILAANQRLLSALSVDEPEQMLGLRPGEAVGCVHCDDSPGGCGTGPSCSVCGAVNAIVDAISTRGTCTRECRIRTRGAQNGGALDLEAQASYFTAGPSELVMLAMRDISSQKRRSVLERTFFHDVLNIVSGMRAVAELLSYGEEDPEIEEEYRQDMRRMSEQIGDEIIAQRQLLAAEEGNLTLNLSTVAVGDLLSSVAELYRNHSVARGRTLEVGAAPAIEIITDQTLLRRVLGNLVKNALEASAPGDTVSIDAEDRAGSVVFNIRNPGVIPEDIQKQIFQRSFSTKGDPGRGIGTHSVKLLAERYLGGEASFTSREPEGTVFTVTMPSGA